MHALRTLLQLPPQPLSLGLTAMRAQEQQDLAKQTRCMGGLHFPCMRTYETKTQCTSLKALHVHPMLLDPGLADKGDAHGRFEGGAAWQSCWAVDCMLGSWPLRGLFCKCLCHLLSALTWGLLNSVRAMTLISGCRLASWACLATLGDVVLLPPQPLTSSSCPWPWALRPQAKGKKED